MRSNKSRVNKNYGKVPKSVKKYVHRMLDNAIEDKSIHNDLTAITPFNSIPFTWDLYSCCNPAQGTAATNRIGRKIRIKSFEMYGVLAAGDNTNIIRMALFTADTSTVLSGVDMDWKLVKDRVGGGNLGTVYYDKFHVVNYHPFDGATPSGVSTQKIIHIKKTFKKPILVTYADDTTATYDRTLFLGMIGDSVAVPHPGFVRGYAIARFEDA